MGSKKIFINIKSSARERHWDTYEQASTLFDVYKSDAEQQQSSIKIFNKNKTSIVSSIKGKIVENMDLINYQTLPDIQKNADLIYLWGSLPKNAKKPYILELDNPLVLAYYNKQAFFNKKNEIKKDISKAKKITFLSNTAKNHFLELIGKEFESKCFVNYPFMKRNYLNNERENKTINFLFVGLDFRGKGGHELLEAFSKVKIENIKLTFISNVPNYISQKYLKNKKIEILPPQSREKLLSYYYPKSDVFVFPTMYESFGVVLLEALSFGMGIITTNVYATHEMIKDNGVLLHHPILKDEKINNKKVINCLDYRIGQFKEKYLSSDEFYYSLYKELKDSIENAILNYKDWQKNSINLYENKFSEEKWKENFQGIIDV